MHTAVGLRFLRTLAKRGERVPAYLLPIDSAHRGASHEHHRQSAPRPAASGLSRDVPR